MRRLISAIWFYSPEGSTKTNVEQMPGKTWTWFGMVCSRSCVKLPENIRVSPEMPHKVSR